LNIRLNVSHYEPENLSVKIVGDRLVITGKHENKTDEYSFVSREFRREFLIPEVSTKKKKKI
jgi:HSP20 family molecular chaperone IbpA